MASNISKDIKVSKNGDEYYTTKKSVDMIVPYISGGGIRRYGVLSILPKANL